MIEDSRRRRTTIAGFGVGSGSKLKIVYKQCENTKLADKLANIAINTRTDEEKCYEADSA